MLNLLKMVKKYVFFVSTFGQKEQSQQRICFTFCVIFMKAYRGASSLQAGISHPPYAPEVSHKIILFFWHLRTHNKKKRISVTLNYSITFCKKWKRCDMWLKLAVENQINLINLYLGIFYVTCYSCKNFFFKKLPK